MRFNPHSVGARRRSLIRPLSLPQDEPVSILILLELGDEVDLQFPVSSWPGSFNPHSVGARRRS